MIFSEYQPVFFIFIINPTNFITNPQQRGRPLQVALIWIIVAND